MNSRLLKFLSAENITQAQFADSIGVARASISHIISGRNKPGYDFICAMLQKYPQLNPEWLILGKGKMYKENPKPQTTLPDPSTDDLLFPSYDAEMQQEQVPMSPIPSKMNENPKVFQDGSQLPKASEYPSEATTKATERVSGITTATVGSSGSQISHDLSGIAGTLPDSQTARRVTKAIVFFDDGTFQELRSIF